MRSPNCAIPSFDQSEPPSVTLESLNSSLKLESSESRSLNCPWIRSNTSQWSCNNSLSNSSMAVLQSRMFPSTPVRAFTISSHSSVPFCTLPEASADSICSTSLAFSASNNSSCFFDWSICVLKKDSPINSPASFNNAICLETRSLPSSLKSNWFVNSSTMLLNFSNSSCRIAVFSSANSCLQSATLSAHCS